MFVDAIDELDLHTHRLCPTSSTMKRIKISCKEINVHKSTWLKMLPTILVKGCHQSLWCCNRPMDQTCVGTSVALGYHPLHFYHHEPPISTLVYKLLMAFKLQLLWRITQIEKTKKKSMKRSTYHNHHTFMEQLFRSKHPKYVVQEGTTEKNSTHLIHKTTLNHVNGSILSTSEAFDFQTRSSKLY